MSGGKRKRQKLNSGDSISAFQHISKNSAELKVNETSISALEFSSTGVAANTIILLNGIVQGNDFLNRVGRKTVTTSIHIRGSIGVGATPTGCSVRWMVVYDKQANGATIAFTDVLTNQGLQGFNNLNNRKRFIVLMDQETYVEATGTISRPVNCYKKCNLETIYSGTTAGIASINSGAIYFMTTGTLVTGVTAPTMTTGLARQRFADA